MNILKAARYAFFPLTKRERQEYLDKVREAVDYYKPIMEERAGVSFGDIKVKQYGDRVSDALEALSEDGTITTFYDRAFAYFSLKSITMPLEDFLQGLYSYPTIYTPFGLVNKTEILRDTPVDSVVLHEMSHHMWHSLGGNSNAPSLTTEGYATYCQYDWFQDIYRPGTYIHPRRLFGYYREGHEAMKYLVDKYGEEILLRVPKEWQELTNG